MNCDGAHCRTVNSEVRVYPIGAGGNLILCQACFAHENRYNFERGAETGHPEWFPQVNWSKAKPYDDCLTEKAHELAAAYAKTITGPANAWGAHSHPTLGVSHWIMHRLSQLVGNDECQRLISEALKAPESRGPKTPWVTK